MELNYKQEIVSRLDISFSQSLDGAYDAPALPNLVLSINLISAEFIKDSYYEYSIVGYTSRAISVEEVDSKEPYEPESSFGRVVFRSNSKFSSLTQMQNYAYKWASDIGGKSCNIQKLTSNVTYVSITRTDAFYISPALKISDVNLFNNRVNDLSMSIQVFDSESNFKKDNSDGAFYILSHLETGLEFSKISEGFDAVAALSTPSAELVPSFLSDEFNVEIKSILSFVFEEESHLVPASLFVYVGVARDRASAEVLILGSFDASAPETGFDEEILGPISNLVSNANTFYIKVLTPSLILPSNAKSEITEFQVNLNKISASLNTETPESITFKAIAVAPYMTLMDYLSKTPEIALLDWAN